MPQPPSTNNYAIGKGVLSVALWSGGVVGAFSDMGNAPVVEAEPIIERLPHLSSRSGLRVKDKNPVVQTEYMITFDLDEMAAANLNRFLLGNLSGNTISALQNADQEFALRFVSDNPIGPNSTWNFHKCTLSPNGPVSLIGEEWMAMSFTGEGLADVAGNPSSPYITVTVETTTTSTTTTTTTTTTSTTTTSA